jgi:hypothetical protein
MQIISAKWGNAAQTVLLVTADIGDEGPHRTLAVQWPCETWHRAVVQDWIAAGGQIAAADPPPAPVDFSDVDNVEKAIKALGLVVAQWANKTPAQLKTAFKAAWESLP